MESKLLNRLKSLTDEQISSILENPIDFSRTLAVFDPYDYQIPILQSSSRRLTWVTGRQVGKSTTLAIRSLFRAWTIPNYRILITAPTIRQSMLIFDKILETVEASGILSFTLSRKPTRTLIQFRNNGKIVCVPSGRTGATIRGFSPHEIVFEEAAYIPDRVYDAATPMIIAHKGNVSYISSPFGKRGKFYQVCMSEAFEHFHTETVENPMVDPKDLEIERNLMSEQQYEQEYEGKFIEDVDTFISRDLFMSCVDVESIVRIEWNREDYLKRFELDSLEIWPDRDYYMGVDVARYGTDENVFTIISVTAENLMKVEAVLATSGKPTTDTTGRIIQLCKEYPIKKVFVDSNGVGGGVADMLTENDVPLVQINFQLREKADMYKHLKWSMQKKILKLPGATDVPKLTMQTTNLIQKYTSTGILQIHHPDDNRSHDDYPDSLALACLSTFNPNEKSIISLEGDEE